MQHTGISRYVQMNLVCHTIISLTLQKTKGTRTALDVGKALLYSRCLALVYLFLLLFFLFLNAISKACSHLITLKHRKKVDYTNSSQHPSNRISLAYNVLQIEFATRHNESTLTVWIIHERCFFFCNSSEKICMHFTSCLAALESLTVSSHEQYFNL